MLELRRFPVSFGQAAPLSALEARSSTCTVTCTLDYSPDSTPSVYAGKRVARVRALSLSVCASWSWPNFLTPGNRMVGSWVGFGETFCLWAVLTAFFPDSYMKKPEFHRVHSLPQPFKVHSHHTWLLWSKLKQGQCYQSAWLQIERFHSFLPVSS